ncbi:hypothetical protein V492_03035 [Pseudogymnoascus sp. VKM F-4246]|nr:hypothetical protein V492_03035 [Pseudogymnoascus sp. VKM F-4246]
MASPPTSESVPEKTRPQKIVILKGAPNTDLVAAAKAATMKAIKKSPFRHAQKIVYVIVGPMKQKFGTHQDLLCATSPYFKAALEGKFEEADLGEVTLKDTSVQAFEMFNEWIYTGEITEELCQDISLSNKEQGAKDKPSFSQFLDVWILGDYLLVPQLQNYVADKILAKFKNRRIIPLLDFAYFYEHTQQGSLMRKCMVDIFVWEWDRGSNLYRQCSDYIPSEMAIDLLIAFARGVTKEDVNPFQIAGHYHVPVKD